MMEDLWIEVMGAPSVGWLFVAALSYFRTLTYLERTMTLELDKGAHVAEIMRTFSESSRYESTSITSAAAEGNTEGRCRSTSSDSHRRHTLNSYGAMRMLWWLGVRVSKVLGRLLTMDRRDQGYRR